MLQYFCRRERERERERTSKSYHNSSAQIKGCVIIRILPPPAELADSSDFTDKRGLLLLCNLL